MTTEGSNSASGYPEIDQLLREVEGMWASEKAGLFKTLRRTRWYHNLNDEGRAYFDGLIDEMMSES